MAFPVQQDDIAVLWFCIVAHCNQPNGMPSPMRPFEAVGGWGVCPSGACVQHREAMQPVHCFTMQPVHRFTRQPVHRFTMQALVEGFGPGLVKSIPPTA